VRGGDNDRDREREDERELEVQTGFRISPVKLNFKDKDPELVGLGSGTLTVSGFLVVSTLATIRS
jgi:hypothetical protein